MKIDTTARKKAFDLLTAWSISTGNKTITRTQLLKLCEDNGILQPQWLTNDPQYRAGRGIYSIPTSMDAPKAGKVKKAKAVRTLVMQEDEEPAVVAAVIPMPAPKQVAMATMASSLGSEVAVPEVYKNYIPFGNFEAILSIVKSKRFFPTFITGPSGNGKTMAVEQACAKAGREFVPVSMTDETDEGDLIGNYVLIDGNMVWRDGPVTLAARKGAVLLIDEIDYGAKNLACLQRVLEGKPFLLKKKNEVVVPAPGFNILATANTKGQGSDSGRYMYTNILNEAFLERFPITLDQPWAPKPIEVKIIKGELVAAGADDAEFAKELVEWADIIRKTYDEGGVEEVVSTRRLVHIAKAYGIFGDKMMALDVCLSRFDAETKASFLDLFKKVNGKEEVAVEAAANSANTESEISV